MKIKLSIKGLVDYMTGTPTEQRNILRQYKYPSDDDSHAKIIYYRDARERIQAFHQSPHSSEWIISQASALGDLARISSGRTKTRIGHNSRALLQYQKHFSMRNFEMLPPLKLGLQFEDVSISITPDLHIRENGSEKIVKLHFGTDGIKEDQVLIYSQAMFEAASLAELPIKSSGILLLDLATGTEHRGARLGARMRKHIESSCLNISAIWEKL